MRPPHALRGLLYPPAIRVSLGRRHLEARVQQPPGPGKGRQRCSGQGFLWLPGTSSRSARGSPGTPGRGSGPCWGPSPPPRSPPPAPPQPSGSWPGGSCSCSSLPDGAWVCSSSQAGHGADERCHGPWRPALLPDCRGHGSPGPWAGSSRWGGARGSTSLTRGARGSQAPLRAQGAA